MQEARKRATKDGVGVEVPKAHDFSKIQFLWKLDPELEINVENHRNGEEIEALKFFYKHGLSIQARGITNGDMQGQNTFEYISSREKWVTRFAIVALLMEKLSDMKSIIHNIRTADQRKKSGRKRKALDSEEEQEDLDPSSAAVSPQGEDEAEEVVAAEDCSQKRTKMWTVKTNAEYGARYNQLFLYFHDITKNKESKRMLLGWEKVIGIWSDAKKSDAELRPSIGKSVSEMEEDDVAHADTCNIVSLLDADSDDDEDDDEVENSGAEQESQRPVYDAVALVGQRKKDQHALEEDSQGVKFI